MRVKIPRTAWRIVTARRLKSAFDGEGARRFGGRFNPPGVAVVYTAENLSLAVLELLVHLDTDVLPDDLFAIRVVLPSDAPVDVLAPEDLPSGWQRYPAPESLARIGADWVRRGTSLALVVPSAVVTVERNLVINPAHRDAKRLRVEAPTSLLLDPRLAS